MRRYIVILMILLLPLRSWAGDLMAVLMTTQALSAASASVVALQASSDVNECAGHSAVQSETPDTGAVEDGHCNTCVTCQICHSVALVNISLPSLGEPAASHVRSSSPASFASATLADSVKPPIS